MVDLKCDALLKSPAQGQAYLIIYGIKGNHSDVPTDVYDSPFIYIKAGDKQGQLLSASFA